MYTKYIDFDDYTIIVHRSDSLGTVTIWYRDYNNALFMLRLYDAHSPRPLAAMYPIRDSYYKESNIDCTVLVEDLVATLGFPGYSLDISEPNVVFCPSEISALGPLYRLE